ncbi:MAG TPA: hypothetical protein VGH30_08795 [Jatrophihabitantaceae bacterium]
MGSPGSSAAAPHIASAAAGSGPSVLFDDTKAETAGNADWIVSTSMPDPTAQDPSPSSETDWTGALSSWGVALHQAGYTVETLPPSGQITYGDFGNAQDLSNFDTFVLPEPNVLFTSAEKAAILSFVQNGGGLFMISDHNGSDRNNDGADSVKVLNDLMGSNDPFGFSIDVSDISTDNPNVLGSSDAVLDGPFGAVSATIIRDGTTATLHPADDSAVKGEVFRTGYSASGTTGAAVATSSYGSGRVAYWGDSSPIDDGTGQSGNSLYDGWNDPAGTDGTLALNATAWLAGGGSSGGGGSPLTNGGFESGSSSWTLSGGAAVTSTRVHSGTSSLALGATNSSTMSATQTIEVPASGNLTWQTYVTTQETGSTAYDKLVVKLGSATVATLSNTSTAGSWFKTTVPLASYAGQTLPLSFTASNGTKLPTAFWVDDVTAG